MRKQTSAFAPHGSQRLGIVSPRSNKKPMKHKSTTRKQKALKRKPKRKSNTHGNRSPKFARSLTSFREGKGRQVFKRWELWAAIFINGIGMAMQFDLIPKGGTGEKFAMFAIQFIGSLGVVFGKQLSKAVQK